MSVVTFICYIILVNQSNYFYNSGCLLNMPLLYVDFIAQFLEIILDIFMGVKFVKHFLFFLRIKQLKLKELGLKLSNFNLFMVFWLLFLVISNLLCVLSRLFFMPIVENRVVGNEDQDLAFTMETIDLWILNFFIPITEMLTSLTFLYLFYFQAKTKIDSEKR